MYQVVAYELDQNVSHLVVSALYTLEPFLYHLTCLAWVSPVKVREGLIDPLQQLDILRPASRSITHIELRRAYLLSYLTSFLDVLLLNSLFGTLTELFDQAFDVLLIDTLSSIAGLDLAP